MQSGDRIAHPFVSRSAICAGDAAQLRSPRVVSQLRQVIPDFLIIWDAVSVFFSGSMLANDAVWSALVGLPKVAEAGQTGGDLILTAALGGLVSPVLGGRAGASMPPGAVRGLAGRATLCVLGATVLSAIVRPVAPGWAAAWLSSAMVLFLVGRVAANGLLRGAGRRCGAERVFVLGGGQAGEWLRAKLSDAGAPGLEIVGAPAAAGVDAMAQAVLEQARRTPLDRVVVAIPELSAAQLGRLAHALRGLAIEVSSLFPPEGGERATASLAGLALFPVVRRPQWGYGGLLKLLFDRLLALLLLLWLTPLLLVLAAAIKLDSKGPVLFRQQRHGLHNGEFAIYKFRTMTWQGAADGAVQTVRGDRRITRIGAILRQSSLDEVPQLLNVLNGSMSLVGPRPHPVVMRTENRSGEEITPDYAHRHRVKPGITGWAQVNGLRGATDTAEQLRRRVEHDNFYIDNWSPWLDLRIMVMTPICLLFRRDNAF